MLWYYGGGARCPQPNLSVALNRESGLAALTAANGTDDPFAEPFKRLPQRRFFNLFKVLGQHFPFLGPQRPDLPEAGPGLPRQRTLDELEPRDRAIAVIGVDALDNLGFEMPDFDRDGPVDPDGERCAAAAAFAPVVTGTPWKHELFRRGELGKPGPDDLGPVREHMSFLETALDEGRPRDRKHPRADGRQAETARGHAVASDPVHGAHSDSKSVPMRIDVRRASGRRLDHVRPC